MDIAVKKLELLDWIMHLRDNAMFEKLLALKAGSEEHIYDEKDIVGYNALGEPLDANAYRAHVNEGLKDMREGRVTSHDDLLDEMRSNDEEIVGYTVSGEPLTLEQYKAKADKGMKDIEEGRYMTDDELLDDMKSW
jgi:predicted transcriptional regulator